jgi:hypothetical protein
MRLRRFLSASAVAALFGSLAISPLVAQDCSGDYEYVEQDCAGSSPGWFGQRPIRVKVVVRRPKFLMAPLAPSAPTGYALPAPQPTAQAPVYAPQAMAMPMPMFTMMATPAMAPAYYQPMPAQAPVASAPAAAPTASGLDDQFVRSFLEAMKTAAAASTKPAAAPAAAPATCAPAASLSRNCSESAGELQQLRRDVDDLIRVTNRLTNVVEKLVDDRSK